MIVLDESQMICMESQCILDAIESIHVGLRNCIEYRVAVIQSRADDGARNGVRHILIDDWADVSHSFHVVVSATPVMCSSSKWLTGFTPSTRSFAMNGTVTLDTSMTLDCRIC